MPRLDRDRIRSIANFDSSPRPMRLEDGCVVLRLCTVPVMCGVKVDSKKVALTDIVQCHFEDVDTLQERYSEEPD